MHAHILDGIPSVFEFNTTQHSLTHKLKSLLLGRQSISSCWSSLSSTSSSSSWLPHIHTRAHVRFDLVGIGQRRTASSIISTLGTTSTNENRKISGFIRYHRNTLSSVIFISLVVHKHTHI